MPSRRRILFCTENPPDNNYEGTFELESVSGPLKCLSLAISCNYDRIIVDFSGCDPVRRGFLFDLCLELKLSTPGEKRIVIAILAVQDSLGLAKLYRAGIDLVFPVFVTQGESNPGSVDVYEALENARQPLTLMAELCPYISYGPEEEITSCKAQQDRLILGGQRLTKLCCSVKHAACEFIQKQATVTKPQSDIHSEQRTENRNLIPFHSDFGRSNEI